MTSRKTKEEGIEVISTDAESKAALKPDAGMEPHHQAPRKAIMVPEYEGFSINLPIELLQAALNDPDCRHDPEVIVLCRRTGTTVVKRREGENK